ncbi:type II toxin-antitoxin system VapC family toxin [Mucilaginibacter sp. UYCu711]|uniref:type II toxin-antitoxin system VapC family toxin n=1 Tax=Mucilaginibacter sp. UYCu711 TaxID=3156339 RepID=UPI003D1D7891
MVIDTNIFIEHLRAKNKSATTLYKLSDNSELFITAISLYELYMGAVTVEKQEDIRTLTEDLSILPFDNSVALKLLRYIIN